MTILPYEAFVGAIKLRFQRQEHDLELFICAQWNHKNPCKGKREADRRGRIQEGDEVTETEEREMEAGKKRQRDLKLLCCWP